MVNISVSESADQLNVRLQEIANKTTKIRSEMEPLSRDRKQALVVGNVSTSVTLKHQLNILQERLEDLDIAKNEIEARLRVHDQNAPEAAKIRDKVNGLWDGEARPIVDEFVKMQSRARTLYGKALEVENKISGLGHEHLRLVGRNMRGPPSITGMVYQLGAFAGPSTSDIRPLDAWQYVSEEDLAAKQKDELDKKLKAHEARIALAEQYAPMCVVCARGNVESKLIVDRRNGRSDQPGESLYRGQWHLVCPKCAATQTAPIPETK